MVCDIWEVRPYTYILHQVVYVFYYFVAHTFWHRIFQRGYCFFFFRSLFSPFLVEDLSDRSLLLAATLVGVFYLDDGLTVGRFYNWRKRFISTYTLVLPLETGVRCFSSSSILLWKLIELAILPRLALTIFSESFWCYLLVRNIFGYGRRCRLP